MKYEPIASGKRTPVNLSLDSGIAKSAREAGLNLSRVSEEALHVATKREHARQWQEEHREAFEAWNRWVEENGIPLEKYRAW